MTHSPAPKYKHILAEERLSIKNTTEKGNDQALGDNLFGSRGWRAPKSYGRFAELLGAVHGILANGITDEPVELGSDNTSKGDGSNLDTGHARRIVDSGQLGSDASILEYPPMLCAKLNSDAN